MSESEEIVRPKEAQRILALGETAFRDLVNEVGFVKVRISRRAVGYLRSEIMAYIAARVAEARAAKAKPNTGRYQRRATA